MNVCQFLLFDHSETYLTDLKSYLMIENCLANTCTCIWEIKLHVAAACSQYHQAVKLDMFAYSPGKEVNIDSEVDTDIELIQI